MSGYQRHVPRHFEPLPCGSEMGKPARLSWDRHVDLGEFHSFYLLWLPPQQTIDQGLLVHGK
jgi:hypothetical protein